MKMLVTGGTGFIGSALVKSLLADGHQVVVFDNCSRGSRTRLDGLDVEIVDGDIRDEKALTAASKDAEVMWHLAYINGTKFFYEKPHEVLDVAVRGALNSMTAAHKVGCKRYVLASSSEVYNQALCVPTKEDVPLVIPDVKNPRFSYGGGKMISELLALHSAGRYMEVVIFRPHNIYGPDMGNEHVIPEFVKKIYDLRRDNPVVIPVQGDATDQRAFCYVDDAAEGAKIAGLKGESGNIYHLGNPVETSIRELAAAVGVAMGLSVDVKSAAPSEGSPRRRCPDITKLKALGYLPKVPLEEGLKKTVDWYLKNLG